MTLVKAAKEERAFAIENPFEFYGSNLSQSKQASWEKIMKQLTFNVPHKDVERSTRKLGEVQVHFLLRTDAPADKVYILCCKVAETLCTLWS